MQDRGIREVTQPIEIELLDDRIHFTCISGDQRGTYSISHHKAANAALIGTALLERHRARATRDNVRDIHSKG
jgi:hypothetical protein